ncbi:MAG TPA: helix-turn-helix domain-containing protein [Bryobacteraceae bacterium]|nr:helix-turn-helix domain-containing protein [Bryobacteraceae bacterium]
MGRNKTISDDELLDAARRVFVEQGFTASTKEIARRAGVSEGVLFQRFQTKEDLFFAAMIPPPADVHRLLHYPRFTGRALLEKITCAMIEYSRDTLPVLLPLMSHPAFRFEEFAKRHPDSPMFLLRRQLVEFLARERQAGRLGAVDPGAAALLIWSAAHAIPFFERLGAHGGHFDPKIVRRMVRALWDGFDPRNRKFNSKFR